MDKRKARPADASSGFLLSGRGERIRTSGLYVPNDVFVALVSLKRGVSIVHHSIKINNLHHFSVSFGQLRKGVNLCQLTQIWHRFGAHDYRFLRIFWRKITSLAIHVIYMDTFR